jgi:hypothetical protein
MEMRKESQIMEANKQHKDRKGYHVSRAAKPAANEKNLFRCSAKNQLIPDAIVERSLDGSLGPVSQALGREQ